MILETFGFETSFSVSEKPFASPPLRFGFPRETSRTDDLTIVINQGKELRIEVTNRNGDTWLGGFEAGPEGLSGLFASPCPDVMCVVSMGYAYLVSTLDPTDFEFVPAFPVKQIIRPTNTGILCFIDYVRITAIGPSGFLWQSKDVSWDGIRLLDATGTSLHGLGWDSPANRDVEFDIDLISGQTSGGSSPEHYK